MSSTLWLFVLYGILGVFGEVVFTALVALGRQRSLRLMGFSFLWMFPIYGLIAVLFPRLYDFIAGYTWIVRGVIYMLAIYLVEYVTGALLKKITGDHVWHYTGRFNLHGHIQLAHAPVWFAVGLIVERYFGDTVALSDWLARQF